MTKMKSKIKRHIAEKSKHLKFRPKLGRSGQKNVIISLSHEWVEMTTI